MFLKCTFKEYSSPLWDFCANAHSLRFVTGLVFSVVDDK